LSEENKAFAENPERAHRILDAAGRLISHYGYDKTTVSDIAREAGVSKGAIYLHWKSKEDLFTDLLNREMDRYVERWLQLMDEDPGGGTFAGIYMNSLKVVNESPFMQAIFKRDTKVLGNFSREGHYFRNRTQMRRDFVKMMQQAGAIRDDISAEVIAHIMNMLGVGFVYIGDFVEADKQPPFDDVMTALGLILDTSLTPPGDSHSDTAKAIIQQLLDGIRQQRGDGSTGSDDET